MSESHCLRFFTQPYLFGHSTVVLVFAGCGAIIVNDAYNGALGHVGVSLSFGLVVMAMIYSVGNISSAHINPAVTLGFLFAGRLEKRVVLPYVGSQLVGAVLAAVVLRILLPDHETLGAKLPKVSIFLAFIIEVLFSFLLMFVILNISTGHMEKGIMAGVAVGGKVALGALIRRPDDWCINESCSIIRSGANLRQATSCADLGVCTDHRYILGASNMTLDSRPRMLLDKSGAGD